MLIVYLAVVLAALYWASKNLLPELLRPPVRKIVPKTDLSESSGSLEETGHKIKKLETLLAEKNKNLALLQTELKIFYIQVCEFDKIKSLLEEEIHRLREQNRIFRSELGLPTLQPRENSIN